MRASWVKDQSHVRPLGLRDREAWRNVIAWMNGKASDTGVVEVEVAECRAIGEGREFGRRAPIGADNGRVAADRERDLAADAHRSLVERTNSAADRIDDMRFDPLNGRGIEILKAQPVCVNSELVRE